MDPRKVFCHNPDCPARGKLDGGNIGIHSLKKRRYICHLCGKTFAETGSKGTVLYPRVRGDLRYPVEFVTQMIRQSSEAMQNLSEDDRKKMDEIMSKPKSADDNDEPTKPEDAKD